MASFVYTLEEAKARFASGKPLPVVRQNWVINCLVVVPQLVIDSGRVDPNTCRPLAFQDNRFIGISVEPIADIGKKVYNQPIADGRQYDLAGGYWGRNKLLPLETFTTGFKEIFYAYSGDRCNPVWCKFTGDVQSLSMPSLAVNIQQSLPVAIRGEINYRPIDLTEELCSLESADAQVI